METHLRHAQSLKTIPPPCCHRLCISNSWQCSALRAFCRCSVSEWREQDPWLRFQVNKTETQSLSPFPVLQTDCQDFSPTHSGSGTFAMTGHCTSPNIKQASCGASDRLRLLLTKAHLRSPRVIVLCHGTIRPRGRSECTAPPNAARQCATVRLGLRC